jgi:hypothetical protein
LGILNDSIILLEEDIQNNCKEVNLMDDKEGIEFERRFFMNNKYFIATNRITTPI